MQAFNLFSFHLIFLLYVFLFVYLVLLQWARTRPIAKRLPPGSMGWPYIGETLKLYSQDPNTFFSNKQKRCTLSLPLLLPLVDADPLQRSLQGLPWLIIKIQSVHHYGDIFKTHILGCPCVMISSPEAAKFVLVTQAHLFKPTYPPSKEKMIGPQAIFFHQGDYHSRLKKLVQASFLPSSIKGSVSHIESIVLRLFPCWENKTINTLQEMKRFAFEVAMLSVFGSNGDAETNDIKDLYNCLERGYNSMPLNLPGTPFHKAMKARKLLHEILRRKIEKKREEKDYGGLLGIFLGSKYQKLLYLNDSQVVDNIIGVIFAAHDTTASVLTWILKYLNDNRGLLDSVTKEQEDIQLRLTKEGNRRLTWEDTRSMALTGQVIQETLRAASILSFTFREAVKDVELQGYCIPKGWKVLPLFRSIHHSSDFFPQPEKFDPSRFEVAPRPNTFLPFGSGVHSCPGSELAKLEILVLLHHLTIKYRWEVVGDEDGIQYSPFPVPKHGLPIRVIPRKRGPS